MEEITWMPTKNQQKSVLKATGHSHTKHHENLILQSVGVAEQEKERL